MIQITPQMRILVAVAPADFRCGIDGLGRLCRERLLEDPMSGAVFVFRNRKATAVRCLVYDGQGFWLCQKRLSRGRFSWWPTCDSAASKDLLVHELQLLLWNGDPSRADAQPAWRPVKVAI